MLQDVAAVQAVVVGLMFAWAGGWKVFVPRARALAAQSALVTILRRPALAQAAHLMVGGGELLVAALLLAVPPARGVALPLASLFALGFLVYLGIAWRVAPEKTCACMGGKVSKISRRSLARAAMLLVMALAGWTAHTFWLAGVVAAPWTVLIIAGELAALWLIAPEFGWHGPRLTGQWLRRARLSLDPTCTSVAVNWTVLERKLRLTPHFAALATHVTTRTDQWREGCWSFVAFNARFDERPATAVFMLPTLFDARDVSATVLDDADATVLLALPSQSGITPKSR